MVKTLSFNTENADGAQMYEDALMAAQYKNALIKILSESYSQVFLGYGTIFEIIENEGIAISNNTEIL